jgi:signal peptidase II
MSYSLSTNRRSLSANSLRWLVLTVAIAILAIVLDALSKWLVTRSLGPGGSRSSIQIVGDFVELHYARNGGVAFGLLSGSPAIAGLLVVLVIVPLVIVLVLLAARGPLWSVAAGMVLGGAAGNLLDRLGDQTVTDFISVGRWPSFNLADSAITAGALLLIGLSVRDRDRDRSAKP